MSIDEQHLRLLLACDIEDVYHGLGKEVIGYSAFPPSRQQLIAAAKHWMRTNRDALASSVCSSPQVRHLSGKDPSTVDVFLLSALVIDAISGACTGVSITAVAVLLVRSGLHNLCRESWKGGGP